MSIFSKAKKYFDQQDFAAALELYQEAGKTYGKEIVRYHVEKCKEQLGELYGLDKVTQLLVLNASESDSNKERLMGFYKELKTKKSENAVVKDVKTVPATWPADLELAPLPESTNDFEWYGAKRNQKEYKKEEHGLSIVVPTFNRPKLLDVTLACLANQKTSFTYEVIVADDGSQENLMSVIKQYEQKLQIKYVRQPDYGYQLCAIRNLGLRAAKYEFLSILDCDMAPDTSWVETYVSELIDNDNVALIGPRKYVDTSNLSGAEVLTDPSLVGKLPEVLTDETLGRSNTGEKSIDWRISHFEKTENLRLCDAPFRFFSGGNVAFARKWLDKAGWFDEEFTHWGGEDNEFGYRLYRAGCFFKAVKGGMAYHQEPPGAENETDRAAGKQVTIKIVHQKVPYFYRKLEPIESAVIKRVPLVSIYVPAYNCEDSIERCIDSALNQTVTDLEVCICDDGSTDGTLELIRERYDNNPRVRFVSQSNGGIGKASNTAVNLCRGYYIGQLDSDDYLEPDAVELCLAEFFKSKHLACVYTTNRNVNPDGTLIQNGYNWPEYSREMLTTAMICHHFRMFTMRAWKLAGGFDENILNAVDYDMYLKLSEVGPFKHVNKISYNRVLHGENTSIKKLKEQKENHFKVVQASLSRQGLNNFEYLPVSDDDACRKYTFRKG